MLLLQITMIRNMLLLSWTILGLSTHPQSHKFDFQLLLEIWLAVDIQYVGTWFPWFQGHPLISGAMPLESGAGFA